MSYQPLWDIWCQIHFYTNNQFYFKKFSLAWVHSLIVKNISISSYSVQSNSSNSNNSVYYEYRFCLHTVKTVLFQTIQFSICTQFSSIWPIDRTLSGAIPPGQSGLGSDGNEGIFHIPQSCSITGTSDYLVSYPGHSFGGRGLTPMQRCSRYILLPKWLGK